MNILALNAGSSSLKVRIGPAGREAFYKGKASNFGSRDVRFDVLDNAGKIAHTARAANVREAASAMLHFAAEKCRPDAIAHRFVHGGPTVVEHCLIDDQALRALESASVFAPLHNPVALELLEVSRRAFPEAPQIACLDTAFHRDMPEAAKRIALPNNVLGPMLRRYGFHGLSCESILRQLDPSPRRLVIAHLGGGASVTAVRDGRSIDTSMGLTPLGGIMMETRSGDIDPGVMLDLLRRGATVETLQRIFSKDAGLAALAGHNGDLRKIRAQRSPEGDLAQEMFVNSVAKAIAAMGAVLNGVELIVLTGGIGEHDLTVREALQQKLEWLHPVEWKYLPTQEEEVMTHHAARLITQ